MFCFDNENGQEIWKTLPRANVSKSLPERIKNIYDMVNLKPA
jgi:hypothetical protein